MVFFIGGSVFHVFKTHKRRNPGRKGETEKKSRKFATPFLYLRFLLLICICIPFSVLICILLLLCSQLFFALVYSLVYIVFFSCKSFSSCLLALLKMAFLICGTPITDRLLSYLSMCLFIMFPPFSCQMFVYVLFFSFPFFCGCYIFLCNLTPKSQKGNRANHRSECWGRTVL